MASVFPIWRARRRWPATTLSQAYLLAADEYLLGLGLEICLR